VKIEWGSQVWLEYEAFLDSGSPAGSGLLGIRVGDREKLPGLGAKLVGLPQGAERVIRLSPEEAFGAWDLRAVVVVRKAVLSRAGDLEDGTALEIELKDGTRAQCRVYRLGGDEDRLCLDFNHPLAGEPLTLFVRVTVVGPPGWARLWAARREVRARDRARRAPFGSEEPGRRS
jgi:FKBP-type peptidyl-prolyl cis-trans isomerase 2